MCHSPPCTEHLHLACRGPEVCMRSLRQVDMSARLLFRIAPLAAPLACYSSRASCQTPVKKKPILFFSDLDGTLVGSTEGLRAWRKHWETTEAPLGSILCYNTARCLKDYKRLVEKCEDDGCPLPVPDVLITGDGTEIRWRKKASDATASGHHGLACFDIDRAWSQKVVQSWRGSGVSSSGGVGAKVGDPSACALQL